MRLVLLPLLAAPLFAQGDWPTHRQDLHRSGRTDAAVDAPRLGHAWTHASSAVPRPAWPGPARWDAYASLAGLKSMRNYDPVYHPVAVGDSVWYPSSAEDAVVCLDAATGEERWRFTTEGPVRIAPTWHGGRLYFGSDDGAAYCLDAGTGQLVWSVCPTEGERRILKDGRLISRWPVRSGVAVEDGQAYFTASLLPWRPSFICSVDAETGDPQYLRDIGTGWTLEGPLALSTSLLVAPQGRVAPLRFDRATGAPLGSFEGGGGSFCIITPDEEVLHGPGNKAGWITGSAVGGEKVASFERGNSVVLGDGEVYLLTDETLGCLDRATGLVRWSVAHQAPYEMILVGDHLLLGGDGRIEARRCEDGRLAWIGDADGRVHGLAFAQGRLLASTDSGHITAFTEGAVAQVVPEEEQPVGPVLGEAPPIVEADGAGLVDRWVFQVSTLAEDSPSFKNLVPGRPSAGALGSLDLRQVGYHQALSLDGRTRDVAITSDLAIAALPTEELTACAWVRIDKAMEWGGIIGASQDNGTYEKGWLLGYRRQRFGFCLNGGGGPDSLTWLVAPEDFTLGAWNHVAATYDGELMVLHVNGVEVARTADQSGAIQYPGQAYYHVGAYRDQDEYFRSTGMVQELRLYSRALSASEIQDQHAAKEGLFPPPEVTPEEIAKEQLDDLELYRGPEIRFTGPGAAEVRWWSDESTCELSMSSSRGGTTTVRSRRLSRAGSSSTRRGGTEAGRAFSASLEGLDPDTLYTCRVEGGGRISPPFEIDTHFNFHSGLPSPGAVQGQALALRNRLEPTAGKGHVLVVGEPGELLSDLSAALPQAWITVLGPGGDPLASSVSGRVRHLAIPADGPLGLPVGFANAVIVPPGSALGAEALERGLLASLRPFGGLALLAEGLSSGASVRGMGLVSEGSGLDGYRCLKSSAPDGAGVWSHMYGTPAASGFGGEVLGGARSVSDLELSWIGRPGPRYQSDRGNRKPAPLSINGRLFVQGLKRVIALDAHNGSILWGAELPELVRFNIPRSSSNWCADEDSVYLAMANRTHVFSADSGEPGRVMSLPEGADWEWGYLASVGDQLIGSAVLAGGHHTKWWGSESWYDAKYGDHAAKVVSNRIFGVSKATGRERWSYSVGRILDATIVQDGDSLWFLEARDAQTQAIQRGRVHEACLWGDLHLVCLDVNTGSVRWERAAKPMPGVAAFYLLHGEGKLVMLSSKQGEAGDPGGGAFALYTFDAETGESTWRKKFAWETDHHGKHISRPAIVDGEVIVRPVVFDLHKGEPIDRTFPEGHQCGTYTASRDALFLRAGELCVWDQVSGKGSRWTRLRPDCWISTIPACGMLLSPEGGGGCSCGSWIEASMGFVPVTGGE